MNIRAGDLPERNLSASVEPTLSQNFWSTFDGKINQAAAKSTPNDLPQVYITFPGCTADQTSAQQRENCHDAPIRIFPKFANKDAAAKIDAIVHDYLLSFENDPINRELRQTLDRVPQPRRDKELRPEDVPDDLRKKLSEAIEQGRFPIHSEKYVSNSPLPIIKKLIDGKSLDARDILNLRASLYQKDADRRSLSLGTLQTLKQTEPKLGPLVETLTDLKTLRTSDPSYEPKMMALQAAFVVKDLDEKSPPDAFQKAAMVLTTMPNNGPARDWLKWCKASEQIVRVAKDPIESVQALKRLAKENNPFARTALASILVSDSERRLVDWYTAQATTGSQTPLIPNTSSLGRYQRNNVLLIAAESLLDVSQGTPTELEVSAISIGNNHIAKSGKHDAEKIVAKLDAAVRGETASNEQSGTHWSQRSNSWANPDRKIDNTVYQNTQQSVLRQTPGADQLVDTVIRYSDRSFDFIQALPQYEKLASEGDPNAILVIVAVAAGCADKNPAWPNPNHDPLSKRACNVLEKLASNPKTAALVVKVLSKELSAVVSDGLWRLTKNADSTYRFQPEQLLPLLGKFVGGLPSSTNKSIIDGARLVMQGEVKDGRTKSGIDCYCDFGKNLTTQDVDIYFAHRKLNKDFVEGLTRNADSYSPEVRNLLISKMRRVLDGPASASSEKQFAILGLGAFAKHLSSDDVKRVALYGESKEYQLDMGWIERMRTPRVATSDNVQEACASTLTKVLASASRDKATNSPREVAYNALRDLHLPMKNDKSSMSGTGRNTELRDALLKYYDDHRDQIGLAKEINLISDLTNIPQTKEDIVTDMMGLKPPAIPDECLEKIKAVAKKYSLEELKNISSNIVLINSLPGYQRARLMGWDQLADKFKTDILSMRQTPTNDAQDVRDNVKWFQLGTIQKAAYLWEEAPLINPRIVVNQLYYGGLGTKPTEQDLFANLTRPLRNDVQNLYENTVLTNEQLNKDYEKLCKKHGLRDQYSAFRKDIGEKPEPEYGFEESAWEKLERSTKVDTSCWGGGTSLGRYVLNDGINPNIQKSQKQYLEGLRLAHNESNIWSRQRWENKIEQDNLRLASQAADYQRLLMEGRREDADELAKKMWANYGQALKVASNIWQDLTVSGKNIQDSSVLQRAHRTQSALLPDRRKWDEIPNYHAPGDGNQSLLPFERALGLKNASDAQISLGILDLGFENNNEFKAIRQHALGTIDSDPIILHFTTTADKLSDPMVNLGRMFQAGSRPDATIYQDFIDGCKFNANEIERQMNRITQDDLDQLKQRIDLLQKTFDQLTEKFKSTISDDRNRASLNELFVRLISYKKLHNLLRKDGEPLYPEALDKTDKGEPIDSNKALREVILPKMRENDLQPRTFETWLKREGIRTILLVAVSAAASVLLPGMPVYLLGLSIAAINYGVNEDLNEIFYRMNRSGFEGWGHQGNKGSRHEAFKRDMVNHPNRTDLDTAIAYTEKVVAPAIGHIGKDWIIFVLSAGIANRLCNANSTSEAFKSLFRRPPLCAATLRLQFEKAQRLANGTGTAPAFLRHFTGRYLEEVTIATGFAFAHSKFSDKAVKLIGPENIDHWGEGASFILDLGISTFLACAFGAIHGSKEQSPIFESAKSLEPGRIQVKLAQNRTPQDIINHYRHQGFEVKVGKNPGEFELRPSNKPGIKPFILEVASMAKAAPRPPLSKEAPGEVTRSDRKEGARTDSDPVLKQETTPTDVTKTAEKNPTRLQEVYEPTRPDNINTLEPFGLKSDKFVAVVNRGKSVQEASEKADATARELSHHERELNRALEPEIQRLRQEHETRSDARSREDYHTMALTKLASGNGEAGLRQSYERFVQAKARLDDANAQLRAAQEQMTARLNKEMADLNKSSAGKQPHLNIKLSTDPNTVVGFNSATRDVIVTPDILRTSPEKLAAFLGREIARARLDFEFATALGYTHPPTDKNNPGKSVMSNLQADFKARTGRDIDIATAREALRTVGRTTKPVDNAQRIADLELAVKSSKLTEYIANEHAASKVRTAAEQVQAGKSNQVIDTVIANPAYARAVFGEPLPANIRSIVEQARRGENVDMGAAQKALAEALDARLTDINGRMKSLFEGMTGREVAVVTKGQAGIQKVNADVVARNTLVDKLANEFTGTEPWKSNAREALERTKAMDRYEADTVRELLRIRSLKETNPAQYEAAKGKLTEGMRILFEGLEIAIDGGPNVTKPSELFVRGKALDNLSTLGELNKVLTEVTKSKASDNRTLQIELLQKCMRELIAVDRSLVHSVPHVLEKALATRDQINATIDGKGKAFDGIPKQKLLRMREVIEESVRSNKGSNIPKAYSDRVHESIGAVESVKRLIDAGKMDRALILADLVACSKDFPNPAFPFKALSEAALNDNAPLDMLNTILKKFQEIKDLFPNGHATGEAKIQLGYMLATARGIQGYEGWIYVPTGKQSLADHLNKDGVFINPVTGEVRPHDFFKKGSNNKSGRGKDFWAVEHGDIHEYSVIASSDALIKAQQHIKDFMATTEQSASATGPRRVRGEKWQVPDHSSKRLIDRQNNNNFDIAGSTGFTHEFMQEVGLAPFTGSGREGVEVSPKDLAAHSRYLEQYYGKVCCYMRKVYARDGVIPAHLAQLAESTQNRIAMANACKTIVNLSVDRLSGQVPSTGPKWTVDPNTGVAEVIYNTKIDTSLTIRDFQGDILTRKGQGDIPRMIVAPDGKVMGKGYREDTDKNGVVKITKREHPLGSLSELYQLSIDRQTIVCANDPSKDNVAALQRMKSELEFIEKELSIGRKLDFSKPPLTDVLARLGGE